jgi:hypothetical protein
MAFEVHNFMSIFAICQHLENCDLFSHSKYFIKPNFIFVLAFPFSFKENLQNYIYFMNVLFNFYF